MRASCEKVPKIAERNQVLIFNHEVRVNRTRELTVRANFREEIRIEISSWNERTNHHHPRANRRYSGHHRLSTEDACGRIDRQTLPDQWQLDGFESGADVGGLVDLHYLRRRPSALSR